MRASHAEQEGAAGEHEVAAALERLGWGIAENPRHDNGTDLFIFARDERGFELGLFAGVQVKSGPSHFSHPSTGGKGDPGGWWFYDAGAAHIDSWIKLGWPHLLVLHDAMNHLSYWVHVTEDAVVRTKKGAKILVPSESTIDEAHREQLLAAAASMRPKVPLEGTIWGGVSEIAPSDRLRHALIVPRVIAPHPNEFPESLSFEQASAMLVQVRALELDRICDELADVPALDQADESSDWGWRFVGALARRVFDEDPEPLIELAEEAARPADRVGALVGAASALIARGGADSAISLLEQELERDQAETVDHGWLQAQLARALAEVGRIEEARSLAASVQGLLTRAPDDLTASAIAGSSAALLFNTSMWGRRDLKAMVKGSDTAAGWWRTQLTAAGLGAGSERAFKAWAGDRSVSFGGEDVANNRLFAAALGEGHGADQAAWRYANSLLGRDELLRLDRHSDPAATAAGLSTLRLAGIDKELKLAVHRFSEDGPAEAVTMAIEATDLSRATRTTALADLTLLEIGGDVAENGIAEHLVGWLLGALRDPTPFAERVNPTFRLPSQLVEALAGLAPACGIEIQRQVLECLLSFSSPREELEERGWARLLGRVSPEAWSAELAERCRDAASEHNAALAQALLVGAAVHGDRGAYEELHKQALGGSVDALAGLGKAPELPEDIVNVAIASLARQVEGQLEDAARGSFAIGLDVGRPLVILNVWHPDVAQWDSLLSLLGSDQVAIRHKGPALRMLAFLDEQLESDVGERLAPLALDLAAGRVSGHQTELDGEADIRGPAAVLAAALGVLPTELKDNLLVDLLGGTRLQRAGAAALARRLPEGEREGILVGLAQDEVAEVRAEAAAALAALLGTGQASPVSESALRQALGDPGRRAPLSAARVLRAADRSDSVEKLLAQLRNHRSAAVRREAHA